MDKQKERQMKVNRRLDKEIEKDKKRSTKA